MAVLLMIGTRKGLFLAHSDDRRTWTLEEQAFLMEEVASVAVDTRRTPARLLAGTILIDGHNDLPIAMREYKAAPSDVVAYDLRKRTPGHTDLARLRISGARDF